MLLKKANNGDIEAQESLGHLLYFGDYAPRNLNEAFKWYSLAANNNSQVSQFNLGCMFFNGEGVQKDLLRSTYWYGKSAAQEFVPGIFAFAQAYYYGYGVDRDFTQAAKFDLGRRKTWACSSNVESWTSLSRGNWSRKMIKSLYIY